MLYTEKSTFLPFEEGKRIMRKLRVLLLCIVLGTAVIGCADNTGKKESNSQAGQSENIQSSSNADVQRSSGEDSSNSESSVDEGHFDDPFAEE